MRGTVDFACLPWLQTLDLAQRFRRPSNAGLEVVAAALAVRCRAKNALAYATEDFPRPRAKPSRPASQRWTVPKVRKVEPS